MLDCVIVGGGISGLLVARELSLAGLAVAVVERGRTGTESSWAGGGILSPLYPWRYPDAVSRLAGWGQARYPALVRTLARDTGIDPELEPSGLLVLDTDQRNDALEWSHRHDRRTEVLGAGEIRDCEPTLAPGFEQALWMPNVGQVRNPRLMKALRADLVQRGVRIYEHTPVTGLDTRAGAARGVVSGATRLEAGVVVMACGAWSLQVLGNAAGPVRIRPVKGQMVLFRTRPGLVRTITLYRGRYVIPRRDGRVLVGSTLEDAGFDKSTSESAARELVEAGRGLLPGLADHSVECQWAGLRPGSPDGVPYVGAHPRIRGLFINAGHYRNGVVLGPAAARLTADLVLDRSPILDPEPYALDQPRSGNFDL